MNNSDPKTLEDANKIMVEGIVGGLLVIQEKLKHPLKVLYESFKNFSIFIVSSMLSISGQLASIALSLGPLAMIGSTIQSLLTVVSAASAGFTIANPLAGAEAKSGARATIAGLRAKQLKEEISDLDKQIKYRQDRNQSADALIKQRAKIEEEYNNVSLSQLDREKKIEKLQLTRFSILRKTEGWDSQGRTVYNPSEEDKKRIAKIDKQLENLKVDAVESIMSIMPELIDSAMAVAGYGLGRKVEKATETANKFVKGGTRNASGTNAVSNIVGKNATMSARKATVFKNTAGILKAIPMLRDITGLVDWLNQLQLDSGLDDFKGLSKEEIKAMVENLFALPTKSGGGGGYTPTSSKVVIDDSIDEATTTIKEEMKTKKLSFWEMFFGVEYFDGSIEEKLQGMLSGIQSFVDQTMTLIGSITDYAVVKDQERLDSWIETQQGMLDSETMSNRRREEKQKQLDKEEEKRQKEINKKKARMEIANTWINAFASIPGIWGGYAQAFAPFGLAAPALIASFGGATTGMVLGSAAMQTAAIAAQNFANSGFVGSTGGKDNQMVNAREGELFLNGRDQRDLLDRLRGGDTGTTINIEQFSGNDDDISRLEDMLYRLQSNGRISDVVFG